MSKGRLVLRHSRSPFLLAAVVLMLASCGASQTTAPAPVQVREFLSGAVTEVEQAGSGICIKPDGTSDQRCGKAYRPVGSPLLTVGQRIGIAVERVVLDQNRSEDIFFVYAPAPSE